LGDVARPGNYEFTKDEEVKLLFLLGKIGGYNQPTGLEIVRIYRTNPISKEPEAPISIYLKDILSDPSTKDITLQDKDILILEKISTPPSTSQIQRITILGEVAKPGNYEFPKEQEIKLLFLLGAAGGYSPSANLETARIFRNNPTAPDQRAPILIINLKEIISNPSTKDITLQNNDVLIIDPTQTSKWNTTIQKISPTLQIIGITLGIIWAVRSFQKD
jgi:protein involved in polysaccharide export with SLBB domain